jgi:WD40 repeat protein
VAVSRDVNQIAAAGVRMGRPAEVFIWTAGPGHDDRSLAGHVGPVNGLAFSPDGKYLATASGQMLLREHPGEVFVWNLTTGQEVVCCKGHTDRAMAVAFSPDGQRLASASVDRTVKLWDPATGQLLATLNGHSVPLRGVAFSPDGSRIASAGGWPTHERYGDRTVLGEVKLWDPDTGREVRSLAAPAGEVTGLAFSRDGRRLVVGAHQNVDLKVRGEIKLFDAQTGEPVLSITDAVQNISAVALSPDGSRIAGAGSWQETDGQKWRIGVRLWDIKTGKVTLTLTSESWVDGVTFSPDGKHLATVGSNGLGRGELRIWDVANGRELQTFDHHHISAAAVAYNKDGSRIATGGTDTRIKVRELPAVTGRSRP